jgi:glycosyltransferase involved in cell wall biosynthesis
MSAAVLHVAKASGISGSENHLLLLLPQLGERGWDVRFLLLHEGEEGARELAGRMSAAGVPVEAIRLPFAGDPRAFARLLRLIRRDRPEIVHTHLVHADFHGLTAARLTGVPVRVSTKHGFNPFRSSQLFAHADRAVASLADEHIAISRGLARYLAAEEGFAEDSFTVIHYGIEAGPEPEPYAGVAPRLLCVGRLIPIKGYDVLLGAMAQARRVVRDLTLDVAGSGPLEPELRSQAAALGLDGAVRFLGHVTAVPFAESAIVVVPSLGEGFGMVALEAMERGRPVIASDVGGLPEIVVDDETGAVVPSGDVQALAWAIAELAANLPRAAALGAAGRARAVAEFRQDRCTDRHEALYREALTRAQARSRADAASTASRKSNGTR